jgi:hypothetical protein
MTRTLQFACALIATTAGSHLAFAQAPPPLPTVVSVTSMPDILQDSIILERDGNYSAEINGVSYWAFDDTAMTEANASGQSFIDNSLSVSTSLNATRGIGLNENQVDSSGALERFIPFTTDEINFNTTHNSSHCTAPSHCGASLALWPGPIVYDPATQQVVVPFGEIVRGGDISGFQGVGAGLAVGKIAHNGYMQLSRPVQNPGSSTPTLLWSSTEQSFTDESFILNGYYPGFPG